jgi:CMP-N-acetylneuraminic acid synthetase
MKLKKEFWAFIPARSGSQGLKNKNIKKLGGLPVIAYSIKTALNCKYISKTIFSSNSKKYINIAKKFGCKNIHYRSKKTSQNSSSELSVFKEFINHQIKLKKDLPEYFIHLRPTSPFRKLRTLEDSIIKFKKIKNKCSSLRTVSEMSNTAFRYCRIENNLLCAIPKKDFALDKWMRPRQFFPKTYICNCVVDIYKTKNILNNKLFGNKVVPFLIGEDFCDIDSIDDFKKAQNFLKLNKKNIS